jgi:hypothetical protein
MFWPKLSKKTSCFAQVHIAPFVARRADVFVKKDQPRRARAKNARAFLGDTLQRRYVMQTAMETNELIRASSLYRQPRHCVCEVVADSLGKSAIGAGELARPIEAGATDVDAINVLGDVRSDGFPFKAACAATD